MTVAPSVTKAREAVAAVPFWYHTIEVAPGVETPGWFDLRPVVGSLPWPDVRAKRCLDVATFDGFLAFELERRGAAEVVALDIGSHEDWDWPPRLAGRGVEFMSELAGPDKLAGFRLAHELLGSSVEHVTMSVYDVSPERLGEFDVVVCGSLLLHLRDPLRALAAIASVCRGHFVSDEEVDLRLAVLHPRRPVVRVDGVSDLFQWLLPNPAGHRRMVEAAGFDVVRAGRPHSLPFGVAHPPRGRRPRALAVAAARTVLTGGAGVPHHALLARAPS